MLSSARPLSSESSQPPKHSPVTEREEIGARRSHRAGVMVSWRGVLRTTAPKGSSMSNSSDAWCGQTRLAIHARDGPWFRLAFWNAPWALGHHPISGGLREPSLRSPRLQAVPTACALRLSGDKNRRPRRPIDCDRDTQIRTVKSIMEPLQFLQLCFVVGLDRKKGFVPRKTISLLSSGTSLSAQRCRSSGDETAEE
jgi:hypothetical protein